MGGHQENSRSGRSGSAGRSGDTALSVGLETQLALVNEKNDRGIRGPMEKQFVIGPSLQFRPLRQMHIDLAPLFGANSNSPRAKVFLVVGWEF